MFKRFLSIVLAFTLAVITPLQASAQALQDQVATLSAEVSSLAGRLVELEKAQAGSASQLSDLLKKLVAMQEANQKAALGKAQAEDAAPGAKETSEAALGVLNKIKAANPASLGQTSDGKPLIDEMISCVGAANQAAKGQKAAPGAAAPAAGAQLTADQGVALLGACSPAKVQSIVGDLNKNRMATLDAWKQCRDTLIGGKKIFQENMPSDPTGLSVEDRAVLKANMDQLKDLQGDALKCRDQVSDLAQNLKNLDDSAAAVGAAMNMVATVCMASGANPYVCAGAFVLALLLQLFGSGKGDGDGDGKPGSGTGNDKGGGMGQIAGAADGDQPGSGQLKLSALPKGGVGGTFGNDPKGVLACTVIGGPRLQCQLNANPAIATTVDPKAAINVNPEARALFIKALNDNDASVVGVCSGAPAAAISRLVLLKGPTDFVSIGVTRDARDPLRSVLDYGPGGALPNDVPAALPSNQKLEKLCSH